MEKVFAADLIRIVEVSAHIVDSKEVLSVKKRLDDFLSELRKKKKRLSKKRLDEILEEMKKIKAFTETVSAVKSAIDNTTQLESLIMTLQRFIDEGSIAAGISPSSTNASLSSGVNSGRRYADDQEKEAWEIINES